MNIITIAVESRADSPKVIAPVLSTFDPLMRLIRRIRIQTVDPIVIGIVALIIFQLFNVPEEKLKDRTGWNGR